MTHNPLRSHENIVRLIGVGWETNRMDFKSQVFMWPFLVLEHATLGSLVDFLEENPIDMETRKALCLDVGRGLLALHQCDIVHGDVKLENVLIFRNDRKGYIAKLGDFGFSVLDLEGTAPTTMLSGKTIPWDAPESNKAMPWSQLHLTDIYSYGLLIWRTISYGHPPFDNNQGILSHENLTMVKDLKKSDLLCKTAVAFTQDHIKDPVLLHSIQKSFQNSLVLKPKKRSLQKCLEALR
jgi:serine/threonine protein kinase